MVSAANPIISDLIKEDPEMRDLVAEFVYGLDQRIEELRQAYERQDTAALAVLTHRIKGAGGSYGYPSLSALGANMEDGVKTGKTDSFPNWLNDLTDLVAAAKAGLR